MEYKTAKRMEYASILRNQGSYGKGNKDAAGRRESHSSGDWTSGL